MSETSSGSGASTAVVAVVALVAILALVWFFFLRGGDAGGTDVDIDINADEAVEAVTPDE